MMTGSERKKLTRVFYNLSRVENMLSDSGQVQESLAVLAAMGVISEMMIETVDDVFDDLEEEV